MSSLVNITKWTVPKVAQAVLSKSTITLIYGWRDGGKSTTVFKVLILKCLLDKHFRWAHCRSKYNEIAGSTFQTIQDQIKIMGLESYFIITKDRFRIINKQNPNNYFFGASTDAPDKIRSTPNLNGVLLEEAHDCTAKDFESLLGTTRNELGQTNAPKFIFVFNNDKVKTTSYIYKTFFDVNSWMYNEVERVHVSYKDNPFIDKEKTEKKLRLITLGNDAKYEALIRGEFLSEESSYYYSAFNDKKLFKKGLQINDRFELLLSFDFNYDPCTCVVMQNIKEKGGKIKAYKEFGITGGTRELCKHIKMWLDKINWKGVIHVTGDKNGNDRTSAGATQTDFKIIQDEFQLPAGWMYQPKINQRLHTSRSLIDACMFFDLLEIDIDGCPELCTDLYKAKADEKSDAFIKDRGENKLDKLDAWRYGVHKSIINENDIKILRTIYG